jgi:large subunit ribosomal protein L35
MNRILGESSRGLKAADGQKAGFSLYLKAPKPLEKHLAKPGNASIFAAPMSKNAGIAKTRKSVAKRFKVTATGKVLRRKQGKRHILQNKNRKRKRNLGKVALVAEVDKKAILANLPFSH